RRLPLSVYRPSFVPPCPCRGLLPHPVVMRFGRLSPLAARPCGGGGNPAPRRQSTPLSLRSVLSSAFDQAGGVTWISLAGSCRLWQKGNGNYTGLTPQTVYGALAELDTRGGFP